MPAATRRWRLDVAYRGEGFHGFAAQPGTKTIAGALSDALATVLRLDAPPVLVCAGRTDAGVHALGQVVHVDLADAPGEDEASFAARVARSCTKLLAPSIVVRSCRPAPEGFDARRAATSRTYRYLVHDGAAPSPLLEGLAWHVAGPLDVRAMAQAAYAVLGEHDFRALCRRPSGTDPTEPIVRRVLDVAVDVVGDDLVLAGGGRLVRVTVQATSFCHQMVRSLVAVLAAIGARTLTAADLTERLRTGDREGLPAPAPPEGLCLVSVSYG
ncbi:MAG TPA: tRNA pseudouridine(38-40) synthase TruA [Acidimicrobiales bacterium]|jgi:tRNA pseudouridine38-40 synthase|nr:tRNA pseudouridine(38-40) synthase TruA [Acidimicrobiales bacterium]